MTAQTVAARLRELDARITGHRLSGSVAAESYTLVADALPALADYIEAAQALRPELMGLHSSEVIGRMYDAALAALNRALKGEKE